jgi:hypothetical protein
MGILLTSSSCRLMCLISPRVSMMSQSWISSLIMLSMEHSCTCCAHADHADHAPWPISFMVSSSQRPCLDISSIPTVLIPAPTSQLACIPCPTSLLDASSMQLIIQMSQLFFLMHLSMHLVVLVPLIARLQNNTA